MREGDNSLFSFVFVTRPDSSNHAKLNWGGLAQTSHTTRADIWWTTFTFLDGDGNVVFQSPRLRGKDMVQPTQQYRWQVPADVTVSQTLFPTIRLVSWSSSC